jgi:ABC-type amino acid transport substrate-binding protein
MKKTILTVLLLTITSLGFPQEEIPVWGNFVKPFTFVEEGTGEVTGFTIDLLEAIGEDLEKDFDFIQVENVNEALAKAGVDDISLAGAAITVTSAREENGVDFSIPYFNSKVGILTLEADKISNSGKIFEGCKKILVFFLGFVIFTSVLIWFIEREKEIIAFTGTDDPDNPDIEIKTVGSFNRKPLVGISQAVYWTVVTMSTVGYGDFSPQKAWGKVFTMVTIFTGIITFGWIITEIGTVTLSAAQYRINSPHDLNGKTVAVKEGTSSSVSVGKYGVTRKNVKEIEEGIELLKNKEVEAVVYDWPVLAYYKAQDQEGMFHLLHEGFDEQYYAFAFIDGDPMIEEFNQAIIRLMENGTYQNIYKKYF